ncbi:hypothetical protein FJR45_03545 [Sulfurimonas sediminis]|uniref:Valyl-tRNA synthetase n=1 Tax=Sulfurimonas sediminis TaxID=2590020 RepID=A0A7M1B0K2_9BACT|nr:DUF5718 family protein [Sulfurimonas sediminis]QOP43076.1 hypothetical protein FJR45_03545 [Sulfurimonas sediminis]
MKKYEEYLGIGIAGNFALHLAQAGELEDFKNIITQDEAAPKGIFPFYLPCKKESKSSRPHEVLFTYPLSSQKITLPAKNLRVQIEPEVGLLCELSYTNGQITAVTPKYFAAYNDCSIRISGAKKISDKKNWGANSKGIAPTLLKIDSFCEGGIMDNFSICSFLRRENKLHTYGENVELNGYSYFYDKLTKWIQNQLNTQEDFGPLENIKAYINRCNNPTNAIISIGATRYTSYGEKTFLQKGDEIFVVLYNHKRYSLQNIMDTIHDNNYTKEQMSILAQRVE